jgi:flagellar basal-body rod modification protein FlgD
MDVSQIQASTANQTASASSSTNSNNSLSMNDFFKLLAAELQNQDPDNATSNDQFMQEMAQYSTLEATQNLVTASNYSMASSLAGKTVSYSGTVTNNDVSSSYSSTGTVEAVDLSSSTPQCYVASTDANGNTTGNWVDYSNITQVYAPDVTNTGSDTGTTSA